MAIKGSSTTRQLPELLQTQLPWSKLAVKQAYMMTLETRAKKLWASPKPKTLQKTQMHGPHSTVKQYYMMIVKIPRKHGSILMQLRTEHIPLAHDLHHINKPDSPTCPCCHRHNETVTHYLLHCPAHQNARDTLWATIGQDVRNIIKLLSQKNLFLTLFTFIASSSHFQSVYGDLTLPPPPPEDQL